MAMTLDDAIKHCYEVAERKCDDCGKEHLQLAKWLEELKNYKTADVVELSEVKKVIMDYIFEQTVSKYPSAELCKASRMGAEGVIYALENAFGAKMEGGKVKETCVEYIRGVIGD